MVIYSDLGTADGLASDRWKYAHTQALLTKQVHFHNEVRGLKQTNVDIGPCHFVFKRGEQAFVTINKCEETINARLPGPFAEGTYTDVLSGTQLRVPGSGRSIELPPRSSSMYLFAE